MIFDCSIFYCSNYLSVLELFSSRLLNQVLMSIVTCMNTQLALFTDFSSQHRPAWLLGLQIGVVLIWQSYQRSE